ncbi:MAG TPA: beta-ketoacyl synthase N-terminal-like domain-containing protein, partial [Pseudomonadota bacterium]|nr:beta-ketoacyl synthase N-terminal-like domain-containing protein [Pseudomonadota bacterium]
MRRAVITGVGVVSPYGCGVERFWTALAAGESAIRPIRTFDARSFPTQVAGEVPDLSLDAAWLLGALADLHITAPAELPTQALTWQDAGCFRDRKIGLALLAALQAWQQAGCGPDEQTAWLSIGLGLEHALLADFVPLLASASGAPRAQLAWDEASQRGLPATRFRTRVDLAADLIASGLGLRGPRLVNCSACAAGTLAVAQGAALIERGRTDLVLCGAADSMINPLGVGGMSRLGACSPRQSADACRPFDRRRDGLVIGEGAALFVLEDEARARARGARPLARVLGWGSTQDAYRATAPRPDGSAAAQAIGWALQRAGLSPQHVDYINA